MSTVWTIPGTAFHQPIESLDQTSRSVGELTDYLQRNPSALIRGRYVEDKGK